MAEETGSGSKAWLEEPAGWSRAPAWVTNARTCISQWRRQGEHFIARWQGGRIGCAVGLHGWEPAPKTIATLEAVIESLP